MKRNNELFPTFVKLYQKLPVTHYEVYSFVLLVVMCALLLLEQITILYFGVRCFDSLYPVVGTFMLVLVLVYAGFRVHTQGRTAICRLSMTDWSLLFFLGWCALLVVLSENPAYCFAGSAYRKEGLIAYLIYGAVFAAARMVRKQRYQIVLLRLMAVVGCILAVYAEICEKMYLSAPPMLLILHPGVDLIAGYTSVFLNSNQFAYFLTMAILI